MWTVVKKDTVKLKGTGSKGGVRSIELHPSFEIAYHEVKRPPLALPPRGKFSRSTSSCRLREGSVNNARRAAP
jgi:hypothetical protein